MKKNIPYLSLLQEMYAMVDASVSVALRTATQPLACHEGCGYCCWQPIPATLLEVAGLQWWLRHRCTAETRHHLCEAHCPGKCFFLSQENSCAAYTYRPIACRRYLVGTQSCTVGENALATRPQHMLQPARSALLRSLLLSAPFYIRHGLLPALPQSVEEFKKVTVLLSDTDWPGMAFRDVPSAMALEDTL